MSSTIGAGSATFYCQSLADRKLDPSTREVIRLFRVLRRASSETRQSIQVVNRVMHRLVPVLKGHYCLSFDDSVFRSIPVSSEPILSATVSGDSESLEIIVYLPRLLLFSISLSMTIELCIPAASSSVLFLYQPVIELSHWDSAVTGMRYRMDFVTCRREYIFPM
jgi:hypothetical protein